MEILKPQYSDVVTYRKTMEFIKSHGPEVFAIFWNEITKARKNISLDNEFINDIHIFEEIRRKYPDVIEFLSQFKDHFLYNGKFENYDFYRFLDYFKTSASDGKPKDIDRCIAVAKRLEELNIYNLSVWCTSRLTFPRGEWNDKGLIILKPNDSGESTIIEKTYYGKKYIIIRNGEKQQDGTIKYRTLSYHDITNFVISAKLTSEGNQLREARISNFDFDVNELPTEEELSSNTLPDYSTDAGYLEYGEKTYFDFVKRLQRPITTNNANS